MLLANTGYLSSYVSFPHFDYFTHVMLTYKSHFHTVHYNVSLVIFKTICVFFYFIFYLDNLYRIVISVIK